MITNVLLQLLTGGLLGLVGQILRFAIGYKKMYDEASQTGKRVKDLFVTSAFVSSLLIGFGAGVIAMISISNFEANFLDNNQKKTFLTLIASGYAGADFIEGIIKKYIPENATGVSGANGKGTEVGSQQQEIPKIV
jgi:hypothetical protein